MNEVFKYSSRGPIIIPSMEYLRYHVALSVVGRQPISLIILQGTSYPFMGNPLE